MFLTQEEVSELTGYQRFSDQRNWLTSHGWQFNVSRIGRPIVGRDYARQKTGFSTNTDQTRKAWTPNVESIRKAA